MDWKDIAIRAAKTGGQAFLAVVIPALTVKGVTNLQPVLFAAVIAAIAASLSVLNNALIQALR